MLEWTEKRFDLDQLEVEMGAHHGSTSSLGGKHKAFLVNFRGTDGNQNKEFSICSLYESFDNIFFVYVCK